MNKTCECQTTQCHQALPGYEARFIGVVCLFCWEGAVAFYARASEQGNVIGLVSVYIHVCTKKNL